MTHERQMGGRVRVRVAGRPFLQKALADMAPKIKASVRDAIAKGAMQMFEERPRKVHLFHDWKGETYGSMGHTRRYANTFCKGNFDGPELVTTTDPERVTCKSCMKKMAKRYQYSDKPVDVEPEFVPFEAHVALEEEIEHANMLAEALRTAIKWYPEHEMHAIAVMGTQITIGDVLRGAVARHDALRQIEGYR